MIFVYLFSIRYSINIHWHAVNIIILNLKHVCHFHFATQRCWSYYSTLLYAWTEHTENFHFFQKHLQARIENIYYVCEWLLYILNMHLNNNRCTPNRYTCSLHQQQKCSTTHGIFYEMNIVAIFTYSLMRILEIKLVYNI